MVLGSCHQDGFSVMPSRCVPSKVGAGLETGQRCINLALDPDSVHGWQSRHGSSWLSTETLTGRSGLDCSVPSKVRSSRQVRSGIAPYLVSRFDQAAPCPGVGQV
jgi:hypothetical protein